MPCLIMWFEWLNKIFFQGSQIYLNIHCYVNRKIVILKIFTFVYVKL